MAQKTPRSKPTQPVRHLIEEADIGSGEKSLGQLDTEKIIETIGEKRHKTEKKEDVKNPYKK